MKTGLGLSADQMHEVFAEWNKGELELLPHRDHPRHPRLQGHRRPAAGGQDPRHRRPERHRQVDRHLLAGPRHPHHPDRRSGLLPAASPRSRTSASPPPRSSRAPSPTIPGRPPSSSSKTSAQALYASKIISYAQGYMLMRAAAKEYKWNLNYGGIALMWRGGCIIRSRVPGQDQGRVRPAIRNLTNLLLDPFFTQGDQGLPALAGATSSPSAATQGHPRARPSAPPWPSTTPTAASGCPPICSRPSATTSAPTPTSASTSRAASSSTPTGPDTAGRRLRELIRFSD